MQRQDPLPILVPRKRVRTGFNYRRRYNQQRLKELADDIKSKGRLLYPPTDISGIGRFSQLADPTGAPFALFQNRM